MRSWKITEDYFDKYMGHFCSFEAREMLGCTEKFYELGYYKNFRWDEYAKYQNSCKNCEHYAHNFGIYFGEGKFTENILDRNDIICRTSVASRDELQKYLSALPATLKAIYFNDIRTQTLEEIERFADLECVYIAYCPNLKHFWDFAKTPKLKVLEYTANSRLTDISEIANAKSLEYFGINTLISRTNLCYIDSFSPLARLENLKEISLNAVMCTDNNIDNLVNVPNLEKLWISPNTFSTQDFAKFEASKFKIFNEYGIYENGDDFICPLGKGKRCFVSGKSKEKFITEYHKMMEKYML